MIRLFIALSEFAISVMNKIDKDDDDDSDDRQRSHNSQRHGPSHHKSNNSSTNKHSHQIKHTSYLLTRCFLECQSIVVEILAQFELVS
jgi:ABC-type Zn2+ transport system substrate-binding protein/surface adhesin